MVYKYSQNLYTYLSNTVFGGIPINWEIRRKTQKPSMANEGNNSRIEHRSAGKMRIASITIQYRYKLQHIHKKKRHVAL